MKKETIRGRLMHSAATSSIVFSVAFLASLTSGILFLSPHNSSAETKPSEVAIAVDTVLAITTDTTNSTLSIPLTPTASGTEASGTMNISVSTNNSTGYTLSMASPTSATALTHTQEPTNTIPSTTAPLNTPTTLPANQWGYHNWSDTQISSNTAPTTYYRIPATTADTIRTTSSPLANSTSRLSFAAKADTTLTAGTYVHTVVFTATTNYVAPPPACPVIGGKLYLQEVENPTATNYGVAGQRVVLKDRRNGQDYYVQNIVNQDGSCTAWMETNLRYAGDGDWDSAWGYPDDRYATTASNTTANTNDNTRPLSTIANGYLGGSQANQYTMAGYFDPNGSTDYTNTTANGGFYGYLYNWCAAMGGQANACNSTSTSGFDTTTSICPAGWRLPTGGSSGEFQAMATTIGASNDATGSTNLRNNFLAVYSGYYYNALNAQGSYGYYWSSTVVGATDTYSLRFGAGSVGPANTSLKYYGQSVRCVL